MIYLLPLAALAVLYWWMRSRAGSTTRWRMSSAVLAILTLAAAAFTALKGGEFDAIVLLGLAVVLAAAARWPRAAGTTGASDMGREEARAMLGVGADAGRSEIEAAYKRLIRRVHPDVGGAPGLAAQLNRARDRLLGGQA